MIVEDNCGDVARAIVVTLPPNILVALIVCPHCKAHYCVDVATVNNQTDLVVCPHCAYQVYADLVYDSDPVESTLPKCAVTARQAESILVRMPYGLIESLIDMTVDSSFHLTDILIGAYLRTFPEYANTFVRNRLDLGDDDDLSSVGQISDWGIA